MKLRSETRAGFSLVEVVMALGLFAFCIVAITGLLSVALGSTRSVVNEGVAVNTASSIFGAWGAQTSGTAPLAIPGLFDNLPALSTGAVSTFYFNESGAQVEEADVAALQMDYTTTVIQPGPPVVVSLDLVFSWPVRGAPNAVQTRRFSRVFIK